MKVGKTYNNVPKVKDLRQDKITNLRNVSKKELNQMTNEQQHLENELTILQRTADHLRAIGHEPKRLDHRISDIKDELANLKGDVQ
jgi:predicted nuclease with TOPRIM domain